jgi:trigger factor
MAQVQETIKDGLNRVYTVKVPHDKVEQGYLAQLEQIGKSAKIAGFRPGKIPMNVLKQRYGVSARAEALDNIISETTKKAISDNNLRPAVQLKIDLVSIAEGQDIEFTVAVEVLPEVPTSDYSKICIEKLVADVEDKAIDEAITRIAKSMREPKLAADGYLAAMGDTLVIDFDGSIDGTPRPGMKGENHRLELGSKSFIDNFEEQLVGSKVHDAKKIKVRFPAEYHAAELSGKEAVFAVTVKEIHVAKPLIMDDQLAKDIGFPSMEKLRERVKDDIGTNYGKFSREIMKRQLLDQLAAAHSFAVPPTMLENEFNGIWEQLQASKLRGELPEADKKKSEDELKTEYKAIAERRIRLGLVLAEVARAQKIEVPAADMRNALMAEARRFPGQEKAVIDYYTQTEGALEQIRAPLLEDKIVDYIFTQSQVTEKKISAEELLKTPQDMD